MSIWQDKQGRTHTGIMVGGQRLHRILPQGASAGDAKLVEAELRQAAGRARRVNIPGDPPMTAVLALYAEHAQTLRSASTSTMHAQRLGPWAEKYKASQAREFAAHVIKDMRGHYAPATINRSLATAKKGLALAWESNLAPENYGLRIKSLPVNNKREVFLSVDQVRKIAGECSVQAQAAIWAALLTGARRGELFRIREEHIGKDEITIPASHTKTVKSRVVPIIPALRPWLAHFPLTITVDGAKSAWRRARVRAGMEHVNFHDLRHSCASIMIGLGVDLYTISKILGHSTVQTTQRYTHLQIEQQRDALCKLGELVTKGKGSVTPLGKKLKITRTPDQVSIHRDYLLKQRQIASANAHASEQKARKLQRVAQWGNAKEIWKFYRLAQKMTIETGIQHEVDHIIPLLGTRVSGLHVENNLQVIEKQKNRSKSNHYEM